VRRAARVECQVVRERDFKLIGSRSLDLSPHGMLVMAQADVLTGEEVLVTFRVPQTRLWFDAQATVARVVHGRRPGDLGRALGLEFDPLDGSAQWLLRAAMRGLPPPLPMREPRIDYAATVHLAMLS
jgi:hypothetical protein